jgi:hypothetical protein
MSIMKIGVPGTTFQTEISSAVFKTSVTSITLSGTAATVTATAHGVSVGDIVTFSGVTGVTSLNTTNWQVASVTSSSVYTIATTLTGTPAGTIIQEPVTLLGAGQWIVTLGANCLIEYNPDNLGVVGGIGATWRTLVAASGYGGLETDGSGIRVRFSGTTATSYFSRIA